MHTIEQAIAQKGNNINILCIVHSTTKLTNQKTKKSVQYYLIVDKTGVMCVKSFTDIDKNNMLSESIVKILKINVLLYNGELNSKILDIKPTEPNNDDVKDLLHWYNEKYHPFIPERENFIKFDAIINDGLRINLQGRVLFINDEHYENSKKTTYTLQDEKRRTLNIHVWNDVFRFFKDDLISVRNIKMSSYLNVTQYTIDALSDVSVRKGDDETVLLPVLNEPAEEDVSYSTSPSTSSSQSSQSPFKSQTSNSLKRNFTDVSSAPNCKLNSSNYGSLFSTVHTLLSDITSEYRQKNILNDILELMKNSFVSQNMIPLLTRNLENVLIKHPDIHPSFVNMIITSDGEMDDIVAILESMFNNISESPAKRRLRRAILRIITQESDSDDSADEITKKFKEVQ